MATICEKCLFKGRTVPGSSHHISCNFGMMFPQFISFQEILVKLNPHGVRNGWALWPFNFDQIWIEECNVKEHITEGAYKSGQRIVTSDKFEWLVVNYLQADVFRNIGKEVYVLIPDENGTPNEAEYLIESSEALREAAEKNLTLAIEMGYIEEEEVNYTN